MRETVILDLSKLIDDTKNLKYKKDFGIRNPYLEGNPSKKSLKLTRVTDEDAKFLNLYGLFVDIESGDIALGMFPDSDNYYCVGNIYTVISKEMFGSDTIPSYIDRKYILECLKLGAQYASDSIYEAVMSDYKESDNVDAKYDSVIMNLAYAWSYRNKMPDEMKAFDFVRSDNKYINYIMDSCNQILTSLEKTAIHYYGAFISEPSIKEVFESLNDSISIGELIELSEPNIEKLTIKYMSYGIPLDFLLDLKSYGLGIKQRKILYQNIQGNWGSDGGKKKIRDSMDMLSSMQYLDSRDGSIDRTKVICYNVIDLIRSIGRENDMFFSIDLIIKFKNRSVFDSLESKFSIGDIMLENKISEEDFVKCLRDYMRNVYPKINTGSMYTRKVLPTQYNMVTYSPYQIRNAGKTFERLNKVILSKI